MIMMVVLSIVLKLASIWSLSSRQKYFYATIFSALLTNHAHLDSTIPNHDE